MTLLYVTHISRSKIIIHKKETCPISKIEETIFHLKLILKGSRVSLLNEIKLAPFPSEYELFFHMKKNIPYDDRE